MLPEERHCPSASSTTLLLAGDGIDVGARGTAVWFPHAVWPKNPCDLAAWQSPWSQYTVRAVGSLGLAAGAAASSAHHRSVRLPVTPHTTEGRYGYAGSLFTNA